MTDNKVHDLYGDDVPRYIAAALKAVSPDWVSMADLVEHCHPPKPNNAAEIQAEIKKAEGHRPTIAEVKERLLAEAVDNINLATDGPIILHDEDTDAYRFADGVDPNTVKLDGKLLIPPTVFTGLFDPEGGRLATMKRERTAKSTTELRESLAVNGWLPELPAIVDEHGVTIVGNSRLELAMELDIEPVIKTVHFGDGEAADARRFTLWAASNVGGAQLSAADRKAVAQDLYRQGWVMEKIADLIKVSTMTVSRDLKGLTKLNPHPERGGRPGEEPAPEPVANVIEMPRPAPEVEPDPVITEDDEPDTDNEPDNDDEPDDQPVLDTWAFTYRSDGTADVSLTFFDYDQRCIPVGGKTLSTYITPEVAEQLALQMPEAVSRIRELLGLLDKRADEDEW
jgi:hypothetical protein